MSVLDINQVSSAEAASNLLTDLGAAPQRKSLREWVSSCASVFERKGNRSCRLVCQMALQSLDGLPNLMQDLTEDDQGLIDSIMCNTWLSVEKVIAHVRKELNEGERDSCMAGVDHLFPNFGNSGQTVADYTACVQEAALDPLARSGGVDLVFERAKDVFVKLAAAKPRAPIASPTAQDFSQGFLGSGVDDLQHRIRSLEQQIASNGSRSGAAYARVMPIIQSSGTGKSRTTLGLMEKELGLMVCIRARVEGSTVRQSLPDVDTSVFQAIVTSHGNFISSQIATPSTSADTRVISNLAETSLGDADPALIEGTIILARWLEAFAEQFAVFTRRTKQKFLDKQDTYFDSLNFIAFQAAEILDNIVPGYRTKGSPPNSGFLDKGGSAPKPREQLLEDISEQFRGSESSWHTYVKNQLLEPILDDDRIPSGCSSVIQCSVICADRLKTKFAELTELLSESDRFAFLAIDEAGSLGQRLPLLRRLMSFLSAPRFWVLLLDTNNRVSELAGYAARTPSSRLRDDSLRLVSPFIRLRHDIHLLTQAKSKTVPSYDDVVLEGKKCLSHAQLLTFLPKMGRPLWNDRWLKHSGPGIRVPSGRDGVSLAGVFGKLINDAPPQWFVSQTKPEIKQIAEQDLVLIMACWRVPLLLTGSQGVSSELSFHEKQVAHHLRTLSGLHTNSPIIKSFVASEPVVSLAVTHAFRIAPALFWGLAIEMICAQAGASQLYIGEAGEEFVRIILTMGLDFSVEAPITAIPTRSTKAVPYLPEHLELISIEMWLSAIVGVETFRKTFPAEFRTWARCHWMNFTHWLRLNSQCTAESPLTHSTIVQAWTRQTALLGIVNQPDWDALIASYKSTARPRANEVFDPSRIVPIIVQTRTRKSFNPSEAEWSKDLGKTVATPQKAGKKLVRLNIYLSIRGRRSVQYAMNDELDHCIYIGGRGSDTFDLISRLTEASQSALSALTGCFDDLPDSSYLDKHGKYLDPQMEDFMDGAMMRRDQAN